MRFLLALALSLLALPAFAAGTWDSYGNARFGYSLAIPPDFTSEGESDNGDGAVFLPARGTAELRVWGGNILAGDFSGEMKSRRQMDIDDGWKVTYQASTPTWTSYSAVKGGSILYVRAIAICSDRYAMFTLRYSRHEAGKLNAIVDRLVPSLKADARC